MTLLGWEKRDISSQLADPDHRRHSGRLIRINRPICDRDSPARRAVLLGSRAGGTWSDGGLETQAAERRRRAPVGLRDSSAALLEPDTGKPGQRRWGKRCAYISKDKPEVKLVMHVRPCRAV